MSNAMTLTYGTLPKRVDTTEIADNLLRKTNQNSRAADVPPIGWLLRWLSADVLPSR